MIVPLSSEVHHIIEKSAAGFSDTSKSNTNAVYRIRSSVNAERSQSGHQMTPNVIDNHQTLSTTESNLVKK